MDIGFLVVKVSKKKLPSYYKKLASEMKWKITEKDKDLLFAIPRKDEKIFDSFFFNN